MYTTPVYYYCSDVCLSTLTTRLFFSRATHKSVRSLSLLLLNTFSRSAQFVFRDARARNEAPARPQPSCTARGHELKRRAAVSNGGGCPAGFHRVPLFGRLTLAPPSELHPRRAGHLLFSLRVLALFLPPPLLSRVSSMPGAVRVIARAARDVASRRVGAIFAIPVRENRGRISRRASPVDGWLWRISRQGEVIDFLSPSSVTRAHAH